MNLNNKNTAVEAVKAFIKHPSTTQEDLKTLALGLAAKIDELTIKTQSKKSK